MTAGASAGVDENSASAKRPGKRLWRYERPFRIGSSAGLVTLDSRVDGLYSTLSIDGVEVAHDGTPTVGPEAVRNHRLATTLADGREVVIDAGYISMVNAGIAVRIDGELVHESHPGRKIAFPPRAAAMISKQNEAGQSAVDLGKLKRNRVPIFVDIATGLLFFIVAKLTDIRTAAIVGAGVGVALLIAQRFVKTDLIGGLALFGIFMMLMSAGFAILFDDDEMIKQRSTIVGLIGATCFLFDGLVLKGRRLGRGISRYMAYNDIDEARMAIGMGLVGVVMAGGNWLVVRLFSTDVWLFYTTFGDIALSIGMVLFVMQWARRPSAQLSKA